MNTAAASALQAPSGTSGATQASASHQSILHNQHQHVHPLHHQQHHRLASTPPSSTSYYPSTATTSTSTYRHHEPTSYYSQAGSGYSSQSNGYPHQAMFYSQANQYSRDSTPRSSSSSISTSSPHYYGNPYLKANNNNNFGPTMPSAHFQPPRVTRSAPYPVPMRFGPNLPSPTVPQQYYQHQRPMASRYPPHHHHHHQSSQHPQSNRPYHHRYSYGGSYTGVAPSSSSTVVASSPSVTRTDTSSSRSNAGGVNGCSATARPTGSFERLETFLKPRPPHSRDIVVCVFYIYIISCKQTNKQDLCACVIWVLG